MATNPRDLGLVPFHSRCLLKPRLLLCASEQIHLLLVPPYYPHCCAWRAGVPFLTVFDVLYMVYLLSCRSCSVSPRFFFRRNCPMSRYRLGACMEEARSVRDFLQYHLGPEASRALYFNLSFNLHRAFLLTFLLRLQPFDPFIPSLRPPSSLVSPELQFVSF